MISRITSAIAGASRPAARPFVVIFDHRLAPLHQVRPHASVDVSSTSLTASVHSPLGPAVEPAFRNSKKKSSKQCMYPSPEQLLPLYRRMSIVYTVYRLHTIRDLLERIIFENYAQCICHTFIVYFFFAVYVHC